LLPSDVRALAPDGIERGGLAFRRGRNGATESLEERDMKKIFGFAAVAVLGTVGMAQAQTSSGTLTITGTIESSINLTIESAGGTTSGTGTAAATSALGNISKYGSAPTGFTLARGASDWTLSSTVGVKVDKANLTSTDYTLTAQLGSAPASGLAWKLNGSTLSDSAATTLTSTGTYGSTGSYSWDIVVADSAAAAAIDNAINFTATSN
jgi:predicted secreted protein